VSWCLGARRLLDEWLEGLQRGDDLIPNTPQNVLYRTPIGRRPLVEGYV